MFGLSGGEDEERIKRGQTMSLVSGIIYGIGWWIYIDGQAATAVLEATKKSVGYTWIPAVVLTIVFIMINGLDWSNLNSDEQDVQMRARIFLIVSMIFGVVSLVVSIWMTTHVINELDGHPWGGASIALSNFLIFISVFVMRFSTLPPPEEGGGMFF